jgi:hypothetical protein
MKKAQIKRSWIIYQPDYDHTKHEPIYVPFLKDAWNKACELGEGAEVVEIIDQVHKDYTSWTGGRSYTVETRSRN